MVDKLRMRLLQGDCLERMGELIDQGIKVDAVITDPPYGVTDCKWDSVISLDLMWERLNRIIKPNGAVVLFGVEPFSSVLRMSNIENYKYDWIWIKSRSTGFLNVHIRPMRIVERISVFCKENTTVYNPQLIKRPYSIRRREAKNDRKVGGVYGNIKPTITGEPGTHKHPTDVLYYKSESAGMHPTQKPEGLLSYLVSTYTNEGDTVLDFTMGSGTTGVSCKKLGRNFIGIELDEKYIQISKERLRDPNMFRSCRISVCKKDSLLKRELIKRNKV